MIKRLLGATIASSALVLTLVGPVAAQNRAGNSLVNVQISDVTIAVPVAVAANLCDISVNVLARQLGAGDTSCEADATSIATPGTGGNGGGNRAGHSLVSVQIADLEVLLPISVAANVCDVAVNVLAVQLQVGDVTCDAVATSET